MTSARGRFVISPAAWALSVMGAVLWLALGPCRAVASADELSQGDDSFLHGRYDEAAREWGAVRGAAQPRATLRIARLHLLEGEYLMAASGARIAGAADGSLADEATEIEGEAARLSGRLADAERMLVALIAADPSAYRARYELGLLYRQTGRSEQAKAIWDAFFEDYNGGTIDRRSAEQLLYVAEAARYADDWNDANDAFRQATAADPRLLEVNVDWGNLFLDKYAAPEARKSFEAVLAVAPDQPDALAGLAAVEIAESYDTAKARALLARALAVNPRQPSAVALHARLLIDDENWATADAYLAPLLAENPVESDWLALSAAARYFENDTAGFAERERQALALDRRDGAFYHTLAELCVNEHRYPEALDLDRKALALAPRDWAALAGLGQSYLRMGDERQGYTDLKKAWEGDRYNVRTYNLLNLYEDVLPKKYSVVSTPHFRLLVPNAERALLARYVPRQLEEELALLAHRYGFMPETPISVELFDDPSEYAVRTVGTPGLGALGVCFGKVITALSPSTGNLNWGMVLWHEEAHVFAIQLSRGRVPRWFTEGLSEYESHIERREWRRTNDFDVYAALRSGRLVGIAALNGTFTHARDMAEMTLDYYLSWLTIDYLVRSVGFAKIVEALRSYGAGEQTQAVIPAITGLSLEAFDRAFRADLRRRLSVYDGQFYVYPGDYADVATRQAAAAKAPDDSYAQAALAVALLGTGDVKGARATASRALAIEPNQREALWVEGTLALAADKDPKAARASFEHILALGSDGYAVREPLCEGALLEGDLGRAEDECGRAKRFDPQREEPFLALAALYKKLGRDDDVEAQLEPVAYLDPMAQDVFRELVILDGKARRFGKVRELGEAALRIEPFDAELHYYLGQAYGDAHRWADAIYEEQSALLCAPKQPAAVHVALGEAYLGAGDREHARAEAAAALHADPGDRAATALAARSR